MISPRRRLPIQAAPDRDAYPVWIRMMIAETPAQPLAYPAPPMACARPSRFALRRTVQSKRKGTRSLVGRRGGGKARPGSKKPSGRSGQERLSPCRCRSTTREQKIPHRLKRCGILRQKPQGNQFAEKIGGAPGEDSNLLICPEFIKKQGKFCRPDPAAHERDFREGPEPGNAET